MQNSTCYLYDLVSDTHEDNNLASKYLEIVKEMKAIIKREHTSSSITQFNCITLPN